MAGKKAKRLTNKEKQLNKQVREDLRERGILPPVKARLNRNKFSREVIKEFKESFGLYRDLQHLSSAILFMLPYDGEKNITSEQIGVVKLLKIALEIKKYIDDKIAQGENTYSPADMYEEVVRPIFKL